MSKQFNVLKEHLLYLVNNQDNFLNRDFIMNIFGKVREQLLPFGEFFIYKYKEKQQRCIKGLDTNESHVKVIP